MLNTSYYIPPHQPILATTHCSYWENEPTPKFQSHWLNMEPFELFYIVFFLYIKYCIYINLGINCYIIEEIQRLKEYSCKSYFLSYTSIESFLLIRLETHRSAISAFHEKIEGVRIGKIDAICDLIRWIANERLKEKFLSGTYELLLIIWRIMPMFLSHLTDCSRNVHDGQQSPAADSNKSNQLKHQTYVVCFNSEYTRTALDSKRICKFLKQQDFKRTSKFIPDNKVNMTVCVE